MVRKPVTIIKWNTTWEAFSTVPGSGKLFKINYNCCCSSFELQYMLSYFYLFSLLLVGEGNGNPLQCSCLENPRDGRAWWAAIYGVTRSWIPLKRLSSSSSWRRVRSYVPRTSFRALSDISLTLLRCSAGFLLPSSEHWALLQCFLRVTWRTSIGSCLQLVSLGLVLSVYIYHRRTEIKEWHEVCLSVSLN